jgi:hypothetical protein
VITITRDPRDVPYSMFAHLSAMAEARRPPWFVEDFDAYFEKWMELGYYFKMVASYWPHHGEPDFLWLRYEELKADLAAEARRLVSFLGWDVTDEDLARVLPLVTIDRLQGQEDGGALMGRNRGVWKEGQRFFREGAVGKNRARLSPEQEARILARARAAFPPECYAFVVTQP